MLRCGVILAEVCCCKWFFSLVQSENMEALVQMVVRPPEDTDEKTRFKYVIYVNDGCCQ